MVTIELVLKTDQSLPVKEVRVYAEGGVKWYPFQATGRAELRHGSM